MIAPVHFHMISVDPPTDQFIPDGEKYNLTVPDTPIAMGLSPVTVSEYMRCVKENACRPPEWDDKFSEYSLGSRKKSHYIRVGDAIQMATAPVVGVSWRDANNYATWLSRKTGRIYRLPTFSERDYAKGCRRDCSESSDNASPRMLTHVAMMPKNEWGFFGMEKVVSEWGLGCSSPFGERSSNACERAPLAGDSWKHILTPPTKQMRMSD
jgi:formylglycine-generating enzyme required for sulfatase activity